MRDIFLFYFIFLHMWCDLWKPVTCRARWNCKIKEISIIMPMFFFIFYGLWTSVTFDTSIRGDPSKKFWKENNSNFHMISITQDINFVPCDRFSQITLHVIAKSWPSWKNRSIYFPDLQNELEFPNTHVKRRKENKVPDWSFFWVKQFTNRVSANQCSKFGCPCAQDNQNSWQTTKNAGVVVRWTTINL